MRDRGDDVTAEEALRGFERFPTWMWRNAAVLDFVGWLREHNDDLGRVERAKAGFYGLDLYSLYRSIHEVISYLEGVDPAAAARARDRYACFDHASGGDGQDDTQRPSARALRAAHEVLEQLLDLQRTRSFTHAATGRSTEIERGSSPNRTPASSRARKSTTGRCLEPSVVLEPA